jgi:hypothetical protein
MADATQALTQIIKLLTPLSSEERHRVVDAAFKFLGEAPSPAASERGGQQHQATPPKTSAGAPASTVKETWMRQNGITEDQLDHVYFFRSDGTFDIHDVPGKTKKERTLNTYVLTGLGVYLSTGSRDFADDAARGICQQLGCLDAPNHASILKDKGSEFNGDKVRGWTITNIGLKSGAALVRSTADGKASS